MNNESEQNRSMGKQCILTDSTVLITVIMLGSFLNKFFHVTSHSICYFYICTTTAFQL